MAFVKAPAKSTSTKGDPRMVTLPEFGPVQISLDGNGGCKGFQVGSGRFISVKVPSAMFGGLKPEVVKAAIAASDAVDAAMSKGHYKSVDKGDFKVWEYVGPVKG